MLMLLKEFYFQLLVSVSVFANIFWAKGN